VVKDAYGPGVDVRINSQGLRGDRDIPQPVPAGRTRMICLGDSFTFGFGVAHDDTWCHQLSVRLPRLEAVNMGMGGYGIGQAYLWYRRDGGAFEHDITAFAVVSDDFKRLLWDNFLGYPKPRVDLVDGRLVATNVPVPRLAYVVPWRRLAFRMDVDRLALVRLYRRVVPPPDSRFDRTSYAALLSAIVGDMKRISAERGSRLVIIYLPSAPDFSDDELIRWYHAALSWAAEQHDVPIVDLLPDFATIAPTELVKLVIPPDAMPYAGAAAHFNRDGHLLMARHLERRLAALPDIGPMLRWQ
jgi:lysophospholipase L1-like esterase